MDSLLTKIVSSLTGDKAAAQPGKDYWVDDAKVKACYECEAPFSVFVRRHHCRICGRIFCSNCTLTSIQAPKDADETWLRVCNYCHRMRLRDDDGGDRTQSGAAQQLLLGSVHATAEAGNRPRTGEATGGGLAGGGGQTSPTNKVRSGGSLSRSSASEGALTWEVPALLERTFGPTAEAVAETAPGPVEPAVPVLAQTIAAAPAVTAAGATAIGGAGSMSNGVTAETASSLGPSAPSGSGLHPLVHLNRQEFAVAAEEHLQLLLWQLLRAEEVEQPDVWMPIVLRLVVEASKALLPAAAAAFGQQDPRFYVKVKRLPDMGRPSDSRVVRGVVAKKNVAHRRMRTDIQQPCVALMSGALEYQRVANRLSSFDTLLEQEREHLRLAVARIAAAKPDLLLVERSVARSAQEELLARGISLVQHTKPELLERLGRCMGIKVAASVEELSTQMVGTCSRFRVEPLPATSAQPMQQQTAQPAAAGDGAAAQPATSSIGVVVTKAAAAGSGPDLAASATAAAANGGGSALASVNAASSPLQQPTAAHTARPGVVKPLPATGVPAKTLMVFDGCPLPLGCTVLLWGAPAGELTKLKRIVKFGVLAAYHQGLECAFLAEELALGTAALAEPDMSRDAYLFRSIARAAISSSRDVANPEHLNNSSRLLLSLSPHVVVPDALEKEQWHAAAVTLHQQCHGAQLQQHQQPDLEKQQQLEAGTHCGLQKPVVGIEPGSLAVAAVGTDYAAAIAAADADEAPGTPGSAVFELTDQQQFEPEFTDPLRRRTFHGDDDDDDLLFDVEGGPLSDALAAAGVAAVPQVAPLWLQGLQLYDRQHVYLSMACRNPRRGLMCEPPAIKRIDYYCQSDLSLAAFIVAAAPHAQKKCQVAGCGDGVTCHVRTFLHAGTRITVSIATLPASEALPGEDRGQVWMWMRPKSSRRRQSSTQAGVRRLPLSQACACMSFGMFLSLCFSAPGVEVFGTPLHSGFVRYFGLGRSVMCLHQDSIYPSSMVVPRMKVLYSLNAQLMWLKQEAAELCQESNEAFDVLESALQSHPFFKARPGGAQIPTGPALSPLAAAAAATVAVLLPSGSPKSTAASSKSPLEPAPPAGTDAVQADSTRNAEAADAAGDGAKAPAVAAQATVEPPSPPPPAAVAGVPRGAPLVSLSAMLSAVRKDRSSFMDKVAEVVQRATPETPTSNDTGVCSLDDSSTVMWDEQLMAGVLELNRLQRSLAITTLTWAATLQEPALFTQMLAASSSAAGSASMAAAAAATASTVALPGCPLAAAAAAAAAAVVAAELSEQGSGSAHGGSMFHLPPSVAAQRMGIADGSEASDHATGSSGVSVPIMPNAGPIAVQAVANLVASEATTAAGGLLEGSQQVMMAVTQRVAPELTAASLAGSSGRAGSLDEPFDGVGSSSSSSSRVAQHARSSSVGSPLSPRARWAAAAAQVGAATNKLAGGLSLSARGSTGSLTALAAGAARQTGPTADGSLLSSSPGSGSMKAANAAGGVEQGSRTVSPSASLASSSLQSRQQQQQLHRRAASGTGSVGTATASAAAVASGEDGSSEDGEVSHDRFVAWMTSHEITAPETDDLSDFYPEQLPDWDENVGAAAAATAGEDDHPAATTELPAVAVSIPHTMAKPPTPPGTPELGNRLGADVANGSTRAPATAAVEAMQSVAHRRTGSTEAAAAAPDKVSQQQQQSSGSTGTPAGLAPIKTSMPPAASRSSVSANAASGTLGLQQIARVALPGRALMPAGINDTVIPIFDAEPTSIAAYFLSSRAYQLQINASMRQILHGEQRPGPQQGSRPPQPGAGSSSDGLSSGAAAAGGYQLLPTTAVPVAPPVNQHGRSISQDYTPGRSVVGFGSEDLPGRTASLESDPLGAGGQERAPAVAAGADAAHGSTTLAAGANANGSLTPSSSTAAPQHWRQQGSSGVPKQPDWLALLLSPEPLHVKHAFEDDSPGMPWLRAKFSVTAYFAPQFAELRRRCIAGGEAAYITSLCRCRKWASRGGKSNAYFAKTRDDRFIVKSLSKPEKASFLEFAPAYFEHMAHAAASGKPTALAKVAGVYSITIKSQSGNPLGGQGPGGQPGPYKDGTIDVLVMENIFYDRQITRIYDLKGSERSRFNADAAANPQDAGAVHLDDNLRRANLQQPILVDQGMLRAMERALWSDTSFLAGLGVMDYSLLVGVDKENNQLVVAIIDFIRTYTWDKQLETWVKSSGILGGNGKEPTIVSPKQYMRRFRAAISSYFTVVPDGHEVDPPMDADAA